MRFMIATFVLLGFSVFDTASADIGALANYRGDWMINGNRKHLVATRAEDDSDSLEMRYAYRVETCPRWTRKTWVMQHDPETDSYRAVIQGRSTEEATGRWDQATGTMTWTIHKPPNADEPGAKPRPMCRIAHAFGSRDVTWTTTYIRKNGSEYQGRPIMLDVLVPYRERQP